MLLLSKITSLSLHRYQFVPRLVFMCCNKVRNNAWNQICEPYGSTQKGSAKYLQIWGYVSSISILQYIQITQVFNFKCCHSWKQFSIFLKILKNFKKQPRWSSISVRTLVTLVFLKSTPLMSVPWAFSEILKIALLRTISGMLF